MATATSIRYGKQALLIGNGATPTEIFSAPCGITSLTKTTNNENGTINMPDCTDPDLAGWLETYEISKQFVISGSGPLALEALKTWDLWDYNGGFKNVRWYRNLTGATGGGYYQGPALLTQWEEAGEGKAPYTMSFTVTFSGKPIFTAAV